MRSATRQTESGGTCHGGHNDHRETPKHRQKGLALLGLVGLLVAGQTNAGNLVTNGDFEAGNTGFNSELTYVAVPPFLGNGVYGIGTDPYDWIEPRWWFHLADHTSGSGSMFIATPDADNPLVWYSDVAVNQGQTYEFSIWAATVCDIQAYGGVTATLQLEVKNDVLSTFTLGTSNVWCQYKATWTAPTTGTVRVGVRDTAASGFGNDFAVDDIAFVAKTSLMIWQAVELGWKSQLGTNYRVEWTTDMMATNWLTLTNVVGNGTTNCVFDSIRATQQRFYRVVENP